MAGEKDDLSWVCVAIFTGFLGLSKTFSSSIPWPLISILLLLFVSVVCYLSAYCGIASKKIGAYIEVVIERNNAKLNWETLNSGFAEKFKEVSGKKIGDLNKMLTNIYGVIGLISILFPPMIFKQTSFSNIWYLFLILTVFLFVLSIFHLYRSQGKRKDYIKAWEKIYNEASGPEVD